MSEKFIPMLNKFYEEFGCLSTSFLQRKLRVSYEQANKLIKMFNKQDKTEGTNG